MALVCDYCSQPIPPDVAPVTLGGTPTPDPNPASSAPDMIRFDLHPECVTPWQTGARALKGNRPSNPPNKGV